MGIIYYTEVLQKYLPNLRRAICARIQMCVLRRKVTELLVDAMETWDFCFRLHFRVFYLFGFVVSLSPFPTHSFWVILKLCHVWCKRFYKLWSLPSSAEREGDTFSQQVLGGTFMPKEIKEAFSPHTAPTAWCKGPDMVGFIFRLFASVSSRIPFDVRDERRERLWRAERQSRSITQPWLGLRRRGPQLSV